MTETGLLPGRVYRALSVRVALAFLATALVGLVPAVAAAGEPLLVVPGGPLAGDVGVGFQVAPASGPVTFEWSPDEGITWTLIGVDEDPSDGFSALWSTGEYSGPAIVRAIAATGESQQVSVSVDNAPPGLRLARSALRLSPNDDGRRDVLTLNVRIAEAGVLSAIVRKPDGRVVADLVANHAVGVGRTVISWDGKRQRREEAARTIARAVADGPFIVDIFLTDTAGNTTTVETQVVVDTRAPALALKSLRPNVTSRGPLRLRFRTGGPDAELIVTTRLLDQYGRRVRVLSKRRGAPGTEALKLGKEIRTVGPGAYRLEVEARDLAGNAVSRSKPLRIDGRIRSRVITRLPGAGRRVALTFDDCNEASAWSRILTTLARDGSKASFFCLGNLISSRTSVARRTINEGHTIGAHGWDHKNLPSVGYAGALGRLQNARNRWWRLARVSPSPFFRPPYGNYNAGTLAAASNAGYRWTVMWDVDPSDYLRPAPSVIAARVLAAIRPGSIVVLHAIAPTASALPAILDGLRARNLEPVALHEVIDAGR